ncbi:NAD(P)-dependent malic enzyme [Bhargavaea beijingensis]|uniref:Malate dehydrogenase (Oxaloacetate-decarboxylating) n=1 Tax=Bhargavaea beijingensis TaxID=426756 RepID=A0A1G7A235_9BACL|nr:malic enzyme-like NAD(P)-binding protein [Bhargavaea beijingensis]MCW1927261.1 NAD-dependent malic enzyme [Bhargavaea beijingensis]RSK35605.1 NAD-dependent malic enzyme [Bhargavaea beijingensis]SDE08859.1 malate dehydrogenase (oxaloacetate-decarboxylating) [Bhargavaea beijingensis]
MKKYEEALDLHRELEGKLQVTVTSPIESKRDLSLVYSPGVAGPCLEIEQDPESIYDYTIKGHTVGVISNGTAVLGLGNIGAAASIPVMEGKAALFKRFGGVDAFPVVLDTEDPDEFVNAVKLMSGVFGGINLEDIAAPACFEIEDRLKEELDIPVFHDDQHGTAIVVAAGLLNASRLTGRELRDMKVVMNGAGAAGVAIAKLLLGFGVEQIVMCDTAGAIYEGRAERMNAMKESIAQMTNPERKNGSLAEVIVGADVFIGVSAAGALTQDMVRTMAEEPIIFAMANPVPEIMPDEAKAAGARIVGTGRSDFPNQVNNILAFPGIFRGALSVRASEVNEEMKRAAAHAIADLIGRTALTDDRIIPDPFDVRVADAVAKSVADAAVRTGVARKAPVKA